MRPRKVLFIMMSLPEDAPYISYYEHYFGLKNVSIDYIIWNRSGKIDKQYPNNYHVFNRISPIRRNPIGKMLDMHRFAKFAANVIKTNHYDGIVSFTIQTTLFIKKSLRKFNGKYIIDIRDFSPTLRNPLFRKQFHKLVKNSYATVVSSTGFEDFLPSGVNYVLSHNIHPTAFTDFSSDIIFRNKPYRILTIGQIRDFEANSIILKSLGNNQSFELIYAGKGYALDSLKNFVSEHKLTNILFTGAYKKVDELFIARSCEMINAFMPMNYNSALLLSNRLYLSAIVGKPIIVNENSEQSKYVKRYSLGICIDNIATIESQISLYIENFDFNKYNEGRTNFSNRINKDNETFSELINNFITLATK